MDEYNKTTDSTADQEELLPAVAPHSIFKQFFNDVVQSLTEPTAFFENRFPHISLAYALSFGIAVNWIAAFLEWITRVVRHETLLDGLLRMRDKLSSLPIWKDLPTDIWAQNPSPTGVLPAWLTEVIGITLNPFGSLLGFIFKAALLFVGVYLLLPKTPTENNRLRDEPDYKHLLRITALVAVTNLISAILGFLPLGLGSFFGGIYYLAILMIALSVRFRVSGLRSLGMIVLPSIVMMFAVGCIFAIFGAFLIAMISTLFGASQ